MQYGFQSLAQSGSGIETPKYMRREMQTRAERAQEARELAKALTDSELIATSKDYSDGTTYKIALNAEMKRRKLKH